MSQREAFIAALKAVGATEKPPLRKYKVFTYGKLTFYIGKAGALRYGPSVSRSIPVSDRLKKLFLIKGHGGDPASLISILDVASQPSATQQQETDTNDDSNT